MRAIAVSMRVKGEKYMYINVGTSSTSRAIQSSSSDSPKAANQRCPMCRKEEENANGVDLDTHSVLVIHLELLENFPFSRVGLLRVVSISFECTNDSLSQ